MAWNLYDIFRHKQVANNSEAIDLNTPGGNGIKIALVTSAYSPNQNTHDFWDDVSANEVSGTNYTAGGNVCANPGTSLDGSGNVVFDADDPATWSADGSGFSNARRAIMYRDTGTGSTSQLIAYSDDFGADKGNVGGDFSIALAAAGILIAAR